MSTHTPWCEQHGPGYGGRCSRKVEPVPGLVLDVDDTPAGPVVDPYVERDGGFTPGEVRLLAAALVEIADMLEGSPLPECGPVGDQR